VTGKKTRAGTSTVAQTHAAAAARHAKRTAFLAGDRYDTWPSEVVGWRFWMGWGGEGWVEVQLGGEGWGGMGAAARTTTTGWAAGRRPSRLHVYTRARAYQYYIYLSIYLSICVCVRACVRTLVLTVEERVATAVMVLSRAGSRGLVRPCVLATAFCTYWIGLR
jgi:hypothetical protein